MSHPGVLAAGIVAPWRRRVGWAAGCRWLPLPSEFKLLLFTNQGLEADSLQHIPKTLIVTLTPG